MMRQQHSYDLENTFLRFILCIFYLYPISVSGFNGIALLAPRLCLPVQDDVSLSSVWSSSSSSVVSSRWRTKLYGWVERQNGEWEWQEEGEGNNGYDTSHQQASNSIQSTSLTTTVAAATATPTLPTGAFKPKQSLGQNFLRDGNTVRKILRAFHTDATRYRSSVDHVVELGPGAGALTDPLVSMYGTEVVQCIEIDPRSVELLSEKHPKLFIRHQDVLQVDYPQMAQEVGQPLVVIGNLPYYITSQILFALADASHLGAVDCATVTMQWEVAQRMVANIRTKDYGILSVVFQLYADTNCHFKIPPTVFYPQPKVDSALVGLHFVGPAILRQRLAGVDPAHLRTIVTTSFGQRRKTIRNSLKKLALQVCQQDVERAAKLWNSPPLPLPASVTQQARERDDSFAKTQALPPDWPSKRPEELTSGQFVELTRLFFGPTDIPSVDNKKPLGKKVWRKLKHGMP